jgi:hypothetical protein
MVQCNPFPMTPDGPFFLALGVIPLLCRNLSKHLRKWKLISQTNSIRSSSIGLLASERENEIRLMAGLARFVMLDRFSVETRVLPTNDVDKDEASETGVSGPPHFVDGQNGAYTYREKGESL